MNYRSQTLLAAVSLLCGVLVFENTACAQRGRGGGGDERRRDGDEEERRRGGDDERRERFSRFFGGGGFPGGEMGGGFPGGGGWNPWGGGGDGSGRGEGGGRNSSSDGSSASREKPRVTLDLPGGFVAGDLDGDGQISYYEWRRWQRTGVAEFTRWDVNGDGFLTPRELNGVAPPSGGSAAPATAIASTSPTRSGSSPAPTTTPSAGASTPVAAVPISTGGNVDLSSPEAQRAKNYFDALDTDKDGTVTPEEFGKSRRLKPMFEKAGQPIAQPVQLPQFVEMYLVVVKSST